MDKIRIDFFDILGYLVPGTTLLIICWIAADSKVSSIWQVYDSIHAVDKKSIFIGLFLSYILGFSLHILGDFLYTLYRNVFNRTALINTSPLSTADKWTLIREHGEKHILLLERWYALRALAQNLNAISLIGIFICLYKWRVFGYFEWGLLALIFICAFVIFLKQAEAFHKVLNTDMQSVLVKLNLEAR